MLTMASIDARGPLRRPMVRITFGVFLVALATTGCSRAGFTSDKELSACWPDCPGETGAQCTINSDCAEVCIQGACGTASGSGGPCDEVADCAGDLVCSDASCIATLTVEPVYPAHADWNDYVRQEEPTIDVFHQAGTACSGEETGIGTCIHSGELRRVIVPGYTSCAGLSISDQLEAFEWECQDGGGAAIFYSRRLARGRGLGDLVQTGGWKANAVTVSGAQGVIGSSAATVWGWSNAVVALPDNTGSTVVELTAPETIYYADSTQARNGYNLAADGIALVVLPGAILRYGGAASDNVNAATGSVSSPNVRAQLAAGGRRFLWIEGSFDAEPTAGASASINLLFAGVRWSRVHRFRAAHAATNGIELHTSSQSNELTDLELLAAGEQGIMFLASANDYNRFDRVLIDGAGFACIWTLENYGGFGLFTEVTAVNCANGINGQDGGAILIGSSDNRLYSIRTHNSASHGLRVHGHRNIVVGLTSSNNGFTGLRQWNGTAAEQTTNNTFVDIVSIGSGYDAISAQYGVGSTYAHATGINSGAHGVRVSANGSKSANHTFVNVLTANSGGYGLGIEGDPGSDGHVFADIALAHTANTSVRLRNSGHRFTGNLWVGASTLNCNVGGTTDRGLIEDTCTDTGADLSSSYTGLTGAISDAVLHIDTDLTTSLVGPVTSDDTANASDTSGSADAASVSDWAHFDNRFRGWGLAGSVWPSSDQVGRCSSGLCRIWDVRLRADDTRLLSFFGAFVPGGLCPASVSGSTAKVLTDQQSPPNTFLIHAIERVLDGAGDDDGLCESDEVCIYAPNLGAYQGEGELASCIFSDGVVTSVSMLGYTINGSAP